jgi:hypothetical protein
MQTLNEQERAAYIAGDKYRAKLLAHIQDLIGRLVYLETLLEDNEIEFNEKGGFNYDE